LNINASPKKLLRLLSASALKMINFSAFLSQSLHVFPGIHFDIIWSITISSKITNVLGQLGKVASFAFNLTEIFYCPVTLNMAQEELFSYSYFEYRNNASSVMFAVTGQ
jgi:hypothetical protein